MEYKKAHIDKRIKQANIDKSVVVLLTGNGKGKSSSAIGMICRALGYEMKIALVKFLKGKQKSGEDLFLSQQKNIQTIFMETDFTWNTQDRVYDTKKAIQTWEKTVQFLQNPIFDLVVLDELTYMINYKYLDENRVIDALKNRVKNQNVIITGRAASQSLLDIADTVSQIKDIKHAFNNNIKARKGIDF